MPTMNMDACASVRVSECLSVCVLASLNWSRKMRPRAHHRDRRPVRAEISFTNRSLFDQHFFYSRRAYDNNSTLHESKDMAGRERVIFLITLYTYNGRCVSTVLDAIVSSFIYF